MYSTAIRNAVTAASALPVLGLVARFDGGVVCLGPSGTLVNDAGVAAVNAFATSQWAGTP